MKIFTKAPWIKDIVLYGVMVVAAGAIFMSVSWYHDSVMAEKQSLTSKVQGIASETRGLQEKIARARTTQAVYNSMKDKNPELSLDREYAKTLLDSLKHENHLTTLAAKISAITPFNPSATDEKTKRLITADTEIHYEALSDELLLSFTNAVKYRLPGVVRLNSLSFERTGEVNRDILLSITRGELPALVKGDLKFKWLGVKSPEAKSEGSSAPPVSAAAPR